MRDLSFKNDVVLLDGSMGRELRMRGVEILETIWSANALLVAPDTVVDVHIDNIRAGADVITTNSYGVIRKDLAKEGIEHRFADLNVQACELAQRARHQAGNTSVKIAGAMPPLGGSFRADLVGEYAQILPLYEEQASILAEHVDLILCETMSTSDEARAAASAACATGKPVWVAWTLHDHRRGVLRSGESIAEAFQAVAHLPISGLLVNCCPPESITTAMPDIASLPAPFHGGYANTFMPIPVEWTLDGRGEQDGLLPMREELNAQNYSDFAMDWVAAGANVVGGCCGTSPQFIAEIAKRLGR